MNTVSWAGRGDVDNPEMRALPTGHSVWIVMQCRAFFGDELHLFHRPELAELLRSLVRLFLFYDNFTFRLGDNLTDDGGFLNTFPVQSLQQYRCLWFGHGDE